MPECSSRADIERLLNRPEAVTAGSVALSALRVSLSGALRIAAQVALYVSPLMHSINSLAFTGSVGFVSFTLLNVLNLLIFFFLLIKFPTQFRQH